MPSFDTVCEADLVKVKNAVENSAKEVGTRFDFKGTSASIELKDKDITLIGDAEFQLDQIQDVLRNKLTKQEVDVRFLDIGDVQKMGGDKVKQVLKVRNGIESELAKNQVRYMIGGRTARPLRLLLVSRGHHALQRHPHSAPFGAGHRSVHH